MSPTIAAWPLTLTFCCSTGGSDGSSFSVFFSLENSGLALKQCISLLSKQMQNNSQSLFNLQLPITA